MRALDIDALLRVPENHLRDLRHLVATLRQYKGVRAFATIRVIPLHSAPQTLHFNVGKWNNKGGIWVIFTTAPGAVHAACYVL